MSLANINEMIKRLAWLFGIVLLIIFLAVLTFLRNSSKKEDIKLDLIAKPELEYLQVRGSIYDTKGLILPNNSPKILPLFQIDQKDFLSEASSLSAKLGFKISPKNLKDATFGEGLLFSDERGALTIYYNDISYQKYSRTPTTGSFGDHNFYQQTALQFLSTLGLEIDFSIKSSVYFYKFIDEYIIKTDNQDEANVIEIMFNRDLNSLPIISSRKEVIVHMNSSGEVLKFSYNAFKQILEVKRYPIITPEKALEIFSNGSNLPIKIEIPDSYSPTPTKINPVPISKMYLAYYLGSKEANLLQPIWVFEGKSTVEGKEVLLSYAVPAIEPKYFQNPTQP